MKSRLLYNPEQIESILIDIIKRGEDGKHEHYDRTVQVAEYCFKINTGKYTLDQIICYKRRETKGQKEQRFNIDMPKTPSFMAKLRSPLDEIKRCDGLICSASYDTEDSEEKQSKFNDGLSSYGNEGLQHYLDEEITRIDCYDPNTFIITELCEDSDGEQYCYPSEFSSHKIWNYSDEKGTLQYVVTRENAEFENHTSSSIDVAVNKIVNTTTKKNDGKPKPTIYFTDATTFTIYGPNSAVSMTEIPGDYVLSDADQKKYSYQVGNQTTLEQVEVVIGETKKRFIRKPFAYAETNKVPAVRVGYKKDPETNFQTVVPFYWDVKHDIDKLINYNNEEVLAIAIHGILKTYYYVEECNHQVQDSGKIVRCEGGYYEGSSDCLLAGSECANCKGTGLKVHTTTQDAIVMKLPEKDEMIPLENLVHTERYSKEYLAHLTEMRKEVQNEIYSCIYGNNRFERSELVSATATEIKDGKTGTNNTLSSFGANVSRLYCDIATSCASLSGVEVPQLTHKYPSDFKLETVAELLQMRLAAKTAGAPYEVINAIDMAILSKQCKDSPQTIAIVKAKEDLQPFLSKTDQERAMILSTLTNNDPLLILYCRFDEVIRTAIERNPNFLMMPYSERKPIRDAIVAEIVEANNLRLEAGQTDIDIRNVNEQNAAQ